MTSDEIPVSLAKRAQQYVTHCGWFIFPCAPRTKIPMVETGFHAATNDPAQIAAWWERTPDANIAVDCGRSNLAVVDLDGPEAFAEWQQLVEAYRLDALALPQKTGGGGMHLIFAQPEQGEVRNSAKRLAPHIDTRGVGGYILLAPSIHPSGNRYLWRKGQKVMFDTFPQVLADLLEKPEPAPMQATYAPPANAPRALQRSYERVAGAGEGCRNDTLNRAAFYLFTLVRDGRLNETDVRETLSAAARRAGLAQNETTATIQSAYRGANT